MRYYSDILEAFFNDEESLHKAEAQHKKDEAKQKAREKKLKEEQEDRYNKIKELLSQLDDLINAYIEDYGSFSITNVIKCNDKLNNNDSELTTILDVPDRLQW